MPKMEMEIVYAPIKEITDPLLAKIEKTYLDSFPPEERRDFEAVKELVSTDVFTIYALLYNGQYAGFITTWQWHDFAYIEHFAIDEAARNSGIGGKALKQYLEDWGKPVVLEVELPTDEMSKRRIGFYERLGFILDNHEYQQPPYRPGDSWLGMRLMLFGEIDLSKDFERVRATIHQQVYNVA